MTLKVKGSEKLRKKLGRIGEIVRKPLDGVRGRLVLRRIRARIADEFNTGRGYGAGGGQQTWAATKPFGDRPATVPPLGGAGGSLARAWAGGAGGFAMFGPRSVVFGVNLPYGRIHREGGAIRVTPKMRAFLHHRGVHLRKTTKTIVIPKRRHADVRAPIFVEAARGVVVEAIAKEAAG